MPTQPSIDDLVSWAGMNESSGTRADEHSTNDWTDGNSCGARTAKVGANAVDFTSASSNYLTSNSSVYHTGFDPFTWTFWVLADGSSGNRILVGKDTNTLRDYYISLGLSGSNKVSFWNGTDFGQLDHTTVLSTGTWYFVAVKVSDDGANINVGISVNAGAYQTGAMARNEIGASNVSLGRRDYPGFPQYFDGGMDEVAFWSAELTADELDWLYNSGSGRAYSDMSGGGGSTSPPNSLMLMGVGT